jgi:hypothetical protein
MLECKILSKRCTGPSARSVDGLQLGLGLELGFGLGVGLALGLEL